LSPTSSKSVQSEISGYHLPFFIFLGPAAELISYEGNRPISMVWRLEFDVPAELLEMARAV
jgi:hypothetical protein